jgi:hypothetical protein
MRKTLTVRINKHHDEKTKIKAVSLWLQLGNLVAVADRLKISYPVIKSWKYSTWWDKVAQELRAQNDQEKDGKIEVLLKKSFSALEDRLENGDSILDSRTGEVIRVPMKGKEISVVARNLHSTQQDIRNNPVQVAVQQATKEMLVDLAKQFAQLAKKQKEEKVIEGEVVADSRDN